MTTCRSGSAGAVRHRWTRPAPSACNVGKRMPGGRRRPGSRLPLRRFTSSRSFRKMSLRSRWKRFSRWNRTSRRTPITNRRRRIRVRMNLRRVRVQRRQNQRRKQPGVARSFGAICVRSSLRRIKLCRIIWLGTAESGTLAVRCATIRSLRSDI